MKKPIRQGFDGELSRTAQGKRVYSQDLKKKKDSSWEYFDDCYVCQAMKKSDEEGRDLSVEELKEVFRKANEQN